MSREVYGSLNQTPRSPKPGRHTDVPPHQSAKYYNTSSISQPVSSHGSPIASRTASSDTRRGRSTYSVSRSGNVSPTLLADQHVPHSISTSAFNVGNHSAYYDDLGSPTMDGRSGPSAGSGHHRSRSATRVPLRNYHSLERDQEREFMPIREPRDRSLDRNDMASRHPRSRERSLDRSGYRDREVGHVGYRDIDGQMEGAHMSRMAHGSYTDTRHGCGRTSDGYGRSGGDGFVMELQSRLNELQAQYSNMKRELDITTEKLGSSMHSIKTFWSPELKKERALRKEEAAKYALLNDQLKMLRAENQKQSALIRQMEEELRLSHMRNPDAEVQQHLEALYNEKEHMTKEIYFLRETIKELEMRIETQKQTLGARDESLKKLLEMKGVGGKIMEEERIEFERMKGKIIETESRCRQFEAMLDAREKELNKMEELRIELNRRDQEIMAMGAKMKTLEEQHHDYQRHIAVLKESLCAKEEHYNMLQADVEELRVRLEEKNKLIEKKTQQTMSSTQDRNRLTQEVQELRDHMEIKDRKINVLQRKQMQPGPQDGAQQAEIISLRKDNEEKQKKLDDSEKKLKKCQEKLKQLENQPQQPSSTPNEVEKLRERCKKVEDDKEKTVKELQKAQEDSSRLQAELERLLEIMTSVEKEKFALNEQIRELQDSARDRDAKLQGAKRGQQSDRTKNAQMLEEARRRESEASKEAAKAQEQVLQQLDRIEELEEAVRKSVDITAQREVAIAQSEEVIKVAEERISSLQSEVRALQKVHNARCTNCPVTKIKMSRMEDELKRLLSERKSYLEELFEMKQEALSAAISEKDSHLAVLEMSGIKNAKTAEQVDILKAERKRLVERIKTENENRVKLLLELSALSHESNGKNENAPEEECQHNTMENEATPHL